MLSLLELHFVLCTLHLDVLQRIMGFYFNYPQINEVGKSDRTRPQGLFPTPKGPGDGDDPAALTTGMSHVYLSCLNRQGIGNTSQGATNFVVFFLCTEKIRKRAIKDVCHFVRHLLYRHPGEESIRKRDEENRLLSENVVFYSTRH